MPRSLQHLTPSSVDLRLNRFALPLETGPGRVLPRGYPQEQKHRPEQANQPHQIRAHEGQSPLSQVWMLWELRKGRESVMKNTGKIIQEGSGVGVAGRWDPVVGCQNLEWFLQPYGQSREELPKKENGFGKVIFSDRLYDFKDCQWCYGYPFRHIIQRKT